MPDDVLVITTMGTLLKIFKNAWKSREQLAALSIKSLHFGVVDLSFKFPSTEARTLPLSKGRSVKPFCGWGLFSVDI